MTTRAEQFLNRKAIAEHKLPAAAELVGVKEDSLEDNGVEWDSTSDDCTLYLCGEDPVALRTTDGKFYQIGGLPKQEEGSMLSSLVNKINKEFNKLKDLYDGYVPGEDDPKAHTRIGKAMDNLRKAMAELKGI